MDKLSDMEKLVKTVRNRLDSFPEKVDIFEAKTQIAKYYGRRLRTRKFTGRNLYIKQMAAKVPYIRRKVSLRVAENVMQLYTQERCDAWLRDTVQDISENGERYIDAYELLDDGSKKVFLDLLMLRLTGDFRYALRNYSDNQQYFSEKINWKNNPCIVDCGAFVGDTFLKFLHIGGGMPSHYYLYEMDRENYTEMLKNVGDGKGCKVHPRNMGVSDKNDILYYKADGDSSKIVNYETNTSVKVVRIDDDVKIAPDFIKMDIEGAEVPALRGGAETIKTHTPTLAICIYHLKDDFWQIPLLIHKICPEYNRYWIEHYTMGYNETVLYVCKE